MWLLERCGRHQAKHQAPHGICSGVDLDDGYHTLPAKVRYEGNKIGYITLTEGKYHQIKRMFAAVGNKITYLERVSFGGVVLDESLERGEYRYLTEEEVKLLTNT